MARLRARRRGRALMTRLGGLALAAVSLGAVALSPTAEAASAPDRGDPFEARPASAPLYGVKPPPQDPARQRAVVKARDGVNLYVETWLPAEKEGNAPPERLPTILIMTPYVQQDQERYPPTTAAPAAIEWFVTRGYAVAQHHVRGTGQSGGCLEQTTQNQIDDGARVIEYLGRDAPWADGNVGMYGHSYDAETQLSTAGLGDPEKTKYLKAIVPSASVAGQYEYSNFDGVPYTGQAALSNFGYLVRSAIPGEPDTAPQYFQKAGCQPELFIGSADQTGDMTPFWQVREYRPGAPNIRAATLWVHGLADWNVDPIALAGFYERLPETTPKKGLFGVWTHAAPFRPPAVEPDWLRADWYQMMTAWYDRYLKGLDTGVEGWPEVQVQGTDGQWREELDWPTTGGPVGQLGLGPGGQLGATEPTGKTSYTELPDALETVRGARAVFETAPVAEALHITGQPVLDVWVRLNRDDAHLVAILEVLRADGTAPSGHGLNNGYRSARHLDPLVENRFVQAGSKPAPVDLPIRVPVRFHPNDLRIPQGGRLRLTVAGAGSVNDAEPSGSNTTVEILHDCAYPSALRFLMARSEARLLNVREKDEGDAALGSEPGSLGVTDGGGLATAPLCGLEPERLDIFGPPFVGGGDPSGGAAGGTPGAGMPSAAVEATSPAGGAW